LKNHIIPAKARIYRKFNLDSCLRRNDKTSLLLHFSITCHFIISKSSY